MEPDIENEVEVAISEYSRGYPQYEMQVNNYKGDVFIGFEKELSCNYFIIYLIKFMTIIVAS